MKKILILGFGRIGQALAKRCLGLKWKFWFMIHLLIIKKLYLKIANLLIKKGFKIADYVSIHMPLNENTQNIILNDEFEII